MTKTGKSDELFEEYNSSEPEVTPEPEIIEPELDIPEVTIEEVPNEFEILEEPSEIGSPDENEAEEEIN